MKAFVGLDYHQSSVQVCVLDEHGEQLINRICNDATEIIDALGPNCQVFAAIEACSGPANLADELIKLRTCSPFPVFRSRCVPNERRSTDTSTPTRAN